MTPAQMAAETWEQMEARHAVERALLMRKIKGESYDLGAAGLPMQGGLALHAVVAAVAKDEAVPLAVLLGKYRSKRVASARAKAYAEAHRHGFTSAHIGVYFGRDRSTVSQVISTHNATERRAARKAEAAQ